MHGWETGLGGVGISLKGIKPTRPSIVLSLGGPYMQKALEYSDHLVKMWNDKIEAANGDVQKANVPRHLLGDLVNGRVVSEGMLSEFYLLAGYVADNAKIVKKPDGFDKGTRQGECYKIALELSQANGWDIVIGAIQKAYSSARYTGPDVHVWNRKPDGTMVDGQLGSQGYQHAPMAIVSSQDVKRGKMSEKRLAQLAWSNAFGLSETVMEWARENLGNGLHESIRFRSLLSESITRLLLEGRREDAIKKYPAYASLIKQFVAEDPSGNLKYLMWQCKMVDGDVPDADDIILAAKLFDAFGKKLPKKDINSYSPAEFSRLLSDLRELEQASSQTKKNIKQKEQTARCEQKVIYEDDHAIVRHIVGKHAAAHYGMGTRWCITQLDAPHFNQYSMNNVVFFYVINRNPTGNDYDKVAFAWMRDASNVVQKVEVYDASDVETSVDCLNSVYGTDRAAAIFNKMEDIAFSVPPSPMALVSKGKPTPEQVVQVYDQLIKGKEKTQEGEIATNRLLRNHGARIPESVMSALLDTFLQPGFSIDIDDYMLRFLDREEVTPNHLLRISTHEFEYPADTYEVRSMVVDHGENVPQDILQGWVSELLTIDLEEGRPNWYNVKAIAAIESLPEDTQLGLVRLMDADIWRFLLKRDDLTEKTINVLVDKLLASYNGQNILYDFVNTHSRLTPYAFEVLLAQNKYVDTLKSRSDYQKLQHKLR